MKENMLKSREGSQLKNLFRFYKSDREFESFSSLKLNPRWNVEGNYYSCKNVSTCTQHVQIALLSILYLIERERERRKFLRKLTSSVIERREQERSS